MLVIRELGDDGFQDWFSDCRNEVKITEVNPKEKGRGKIGDTPVYAEMAEATSSQRKDFSFSGVHTPDVASYNGQVRLIVLYFGGPHCQKR